MFSYKFMICVILQTQFQLSIYLVLRGNAIQQEIRRVGEFLTLRIGL